MGLQSVQILEVFVIASNLYRRDEKNRKIAALLTSSSLNQEKLSAVSTNQYSLAPPFMMLMLLMVSQPLRMTWVEGNVRKLEMAEKQSRNRKGKP